MDKLTQILASDDLNAPQEEMVFEAAMLWLNKCPTRRQSLEKVSSSSVFHTEWRNHPSRASARNMGREEAAGLAIVIF